MADLIFKCPKCKQERKVTVCMTDCLVNVPIMNIDEEGIISYGFPEICDSTSIAYVCSECGYKLPVEPDLADETLVEWLESRPYNKKNKTKKKGK